MGREHIGERDNRIRGENGVKIKRICWRESIE